MKLKSISKLPNAGHVGADPLTFILPLLLPVGIGPRNLVTLGKSQQASCAQMFRTHLQTILP